MKLGLVHVQSHEPRRRKKTKARYKNCKNCDSSNLLSFGPDQLCCDCDWHTCFEYVDKGFMNNLHYALGEHYPKSRAKVTLETVPNLPKGNNPIEPDTTTVTDSEADNKITA